jgi:hypothetical protein
MPNKVKCFNLKAACGKSRNKLIIASDVSFCIFAKSMLENDGCSKGLG